jgi:hypothetical protein
MSLPSYAYDVSAIASTVPGLDVAPSAGRAALQYRDLQCDPLTRDLVLTRGDLTLVSGVPAIRQAVEFAMRSFRGEWFLDTSAGVPYFQQVLVKGANINALKATFSAAVLAVPGIASVPTMALAYNGTTRTLRIEWSATTDTGEITTGVVNLDQGVS